MHLRACTVVLLTLSCSALCQESGKDAASQTLESVNQFSVKLYQVLADDDRQGNLIFSPFSVDLVLAMAYVGAGGLTAKEIADGLNVPNNITAVETGYRTVMGDLEGKTRAVTLELANKLYADKSGQIYLEYVTKIQDVFKADVGVVDFQNDGRAALKDINEWAETATHGKIKNVISQDLLKSNTRLIALNAVYFYGKWLYTFNERRTEKKDFHLSTGLTVKADLMKQKGRFPYGQFDDFEVLKMYYQGKDTSMIILLPSERFGLAKVESKLHELNFANINLGLWTRDVIVTLPKFRVESDMNLKSPLKKMGISNIFDPEANFSKISSKRLHISDIVQKAFVEVTEEGTEAAAVTGSSTIIRPGPPPQLPVYFTADHPFVFIIQDENSKAILFMGRFTAP
ncbi:leukocyte elastase inhibitor [Anabrus simplex]|uniref:leukocyte elastase inhibitor n=1 Tax=Anabrus simplex TaxID=316456 RepID=UPI0035A2649D